MMPYAPYVGPVRLGVISGSSAALKQAPQDSSLAPQLAAFTVVEGVIVLGSSAASAYHGYKRNRSVGWAVWWGLMGFIFPIVTPAVAIAQGFGKREKK